MRAIRPFLCFLLSGAATSAAEPAQAVGAGQPEATGGTLPAATGAPQSAGGSKPAGSQGAGPTLPAIFAPKQGAGAPSGGRSGASKKLRELLERPVSGRAISPEMSAKLGEVTKRAVPAAPAASTGAAGSAASESSDTVMLDPYHVTEGKLPNMKEREMLTPAGKLAEARRRQPGLNLGAIPLLNDALALQMLEDDFARERREEEKDLRGLMKIDGQDVPADVKKQIDAGAAQRKSWIDERGTPFRPPK